jgi:hypothetical protein
MGAIASAAATAIGADLESKDVILVLVHQIAIVMKMGAQGYGTACVGYTKL